ncbi:MAG: hypothetical protein WCC92_21905 [Candidatus Korobacteraceae bacterium]
MERMNQNAHLDLLRQANASLVRFLDRSFGTPSLGTDEELNALLGVEETLRSVGVLLDGRLQSTPDLAIREELARYRENLLSLHRELSLMHDSATACRARLYSRQDHLHAVKAWCVASRDTR